MLDPREGRGEVVPALTGAGEGVVVPGETADGLRRGREDEVEEERDGGSEFKSGDMVNLRRRKGRCSKDRASKEQLTEARYSLWAAGHDSGSSEDYSFLGIASPTCLPCPLRRAKY